jgi:hypothetical protein
MNMSFLRKRESGNLMKSGDIVGGRDAMMACLKPRKDAFCRRSGERRNPVKPSSWIPAFAGMTDCSWPHTQLLILHELNMSTVRPEPVEACPEPAEWGLCFDKLSTNELANKSGWINNSKTFFDHL